jgi:hypothetical protein
MDAFAIVYPQYYLLPKLETRFAIHYVVFKDAFYQLKKLGLNELWVLGLFQPLLLTYIYIFCHYHEEQF